MIINFHYLLNQIHRHHHHHQKICCCSSHRYVSRHSQTIPRLSDDQVDESIYMGEMFFYIGSKTAAKYITMQSNYITQRALIPSIWVYYLLDPEYQYLYTRCSKGEIRLCYLCLSLFLLKFVSENRLC